jgi:hypothetical protein
MVVSRGGGQRRPAAPARFGNLDDTFRLCSRPLQTHVGVLAKQA